MKHILPTMAFIAICGAPIAHDLYKPAECVTDACVFEQCAKDLGRPCTDEDVFGPVAPCDDDLPADHPEYCPEEQS